MEFRRALTARQQALGAEEHHEHDDHAVDEKTRIAQIDALKKRTGNLMDVARRLRQDEAVERREDEATDDDTRDVPPFRRARASPV